VQGKFIGILPGEVPKAEAKVRINTVGWTVRRHFRVSGSSRIFVGENDRFDVLRGRMCRSEDFLECDARISGVMYFSAADEAEFGQQAEHATVVEVGVYPEAACAALPGQCHGAAHEFGRYALSFDLLCDGQTVQDDVWGLVEPRAVDFGIGRFAVEDDSPVSDDESCVST